MARTPQSAPTPVRPWPWWRRHKTISALLVLAVIAGGLTFWQPWRTCGAGMTAAGDTCVGLNLDKTPFSADKTMADLQRRIGKANNDVDRKNAEIGRDDFITVVVLNNMTPDAGSDSAALLNVQHSIMGALAAQQRLNEEPAVGAMVPAVKLLLANYGSEAREQAEAVRQIVEHRDELNIVAVIGLGQSRTETRTAAHELSKKKIAVISAVSSADDMNLVPGGTDPIDGFYRITPTNTDAANAAVTHLRNLGVQNVMLVRDLNKSDIYSTNLGEAFEKAYENEFEGNVLPTAVFNSAADADGNLTREELLQGQFGPIRNQMCSARPKMVYFAGRGADLKEFLRALGQGSACEGMAKIDVLTSDDASSLLGSALPKMGSIQADVYYTSVATADMWKDEPGQIINQTNYEIFETAFNAAFKDISNEALRDGYAMAHYDSLLLAVSTARKITGVTENLKVVASRIPVFYGPTSPLGGATGELAFTDESRGNPIGKALPIMRMHQNGQIQKVDIICTSDTPVGGSC